MRYFSGLERLTAEGLLTDKCGGEGMLFSALNAA
jgi:hypothetical protein